MFRNLRFFQVHSPWPANEAELTEQLAERAFTPCGAFAEQSAGWEAPTGVEDDPLCRRVAGADLLQLRTQSRVLPAAAVREALEERVAEFRRRTKLEPPRRELRRLRMETREQLLSRALVKSDRTRACFLADEALLVVDAATPARAEWLLDHLRPCLGSLQCAPADLGFQPAALMKRLFLGPPLAGLRLGEECRMQNPTDTRSTGTWRHFDLTDPALRRHVEEGLGLSQLGLVLDEVMQFVLAEDGAVGKLKLLDMDDDGGDEDPVAALDAEIALLAGALRRLLKALKAAGSA